MNRYSSEFGVRSSEFDATCRRAAALRTPHFALRTSSPFRNPKSKIRNLVLALCLLTATGGCGYTVGAPFSADIRTVYVPTFTTSSNRRGLEYQLTEAVQKQIQERSHFRLANEADADTILRGRIVDGTKRTLGQTSNSDPRELQINLQVEIVWENARTGELLRKENVDIAPEALQMVAQSEFAPEVGQSLASGNREVIDRLARDIVNRMEMPWR